MNECGGGTLLPPRSALLDRTADADVAAMGDWYVDRLHALAPARLGFAANTQTN